MAYIVDKEVQRPVVLLAVKKYGHIDAGFYWEDHCGRQLFEAGWTMLPEERSGVFWHGPTKFLLIVYVDDFKIAAPTKDHDRLWAELRAVIDLGPEKRRRTFSRLRSRERKLHCRDGPPPPGVASVVSSSSALNQRRL